jgi:hypothetical protein
VSPSLPVGGICYYWQQAGTQPWHREVVDGSANARNPSIAWNGHAVVIAAWQLPGNIVYWSQTAGTGTWNKQVINGSLQQYDGYAPPSIASTPHGAAIVADNGNIKHAALDYWTQTAGDSGPWVLQQPYHGPVPYVGHIEPRSIAWTGNNVIMTTTDSCLDVDYWWQKPATTTWQRQRVQINSGWPDTTCA